MTTRGQGMMEYEYQQNRQTAAAPTDAFFIVVNDVLSDIIVCINAGGISLWTRQPPDVCYDY